MHRCEGKANKRRDHFINSFSPLKCIPPSSDAMADGDGPEAAQSRLRARQTVQSDVHIISERKRRRAVRR